MTNEEILAAAKEAGYWQEHTNTWMCSTEAMYELAAIIERNMIERCADYVDEVCTYGDTHLLVKAIRKLGEQ